MSPDLIVCRSEGKIPASIREKISLFCHVPPDQVIGVRDVSCVYRVPLVLQDEGLVEFFKKRLNLDVPPRQPKQLLSKWRVLADRFERLPREVTIALVGKYTQLEDSYASVNKALKHAALAVNHRLNLCCIEADDLEPETQRDNPSKYHEAWHQLVKANGIIIPGGFGVRGTGGKINAANWARTNKIPFLGVCLGLQCAVIEFSRNVLNLNAADSTEFNPNTPHPVVIEMPEHNPGQLGGTMRLGKRTTIFKDDNSLLRKLYGNRESVEERHRHRYEVNPKYVEMIEKLGLKFVGRSEDGERMEIIELQDHPYFVGVQYHPEYISRPLKPSPPYLGLLLAATGKIKSFCNRGCQLSPEISYSEPSSDDEEEEEKLVAPAVELDSLSNLENGLTDSDS